MEDDVVEGLDALLVEPDNYFPEGPKPTELQFTRKTKSDPNEITIRLIGRHSLWGHRLSNAGKVMTEYLDNPDVVRDKKILELGCGAGLPSLVTTLQGAEKIVITDYPDAELQENVVYNVKKNIPMELQSRVVVQGHLWGKDIDALLTLLDPSKTVKYDIIILADVLFNHTCHNELLKTCSECVADDGQVLITVTHHKPKLREKDLHFLTLAAENGFIVTHLFSEKLTPMFPEDVGDEEIRSMVHFYVLNKKL